MKIAAIVLIVIGVIALAYGGISYTREKKVLDIGPLEATTQTRETIPLPPILGVAAIAGGVVMLLVSGAGASRRCGMPADGDRRNRMLNAEAEHGEGRRVRRHARS